MQVQKLKSKSDKTMKVSKEKNISLYSPIFLPIGSLYLNHFQILSVSFSAQIYSVCSSMTSSLNLLFHTILLAIICGCFVQMFFFNRYIIETIPDFIIVCTYYVLLITMTYNLFITRLLTKTNILVCKLYSIFSNLLCTLSSTRLNLDNSCLLLNIRV